MRVDRWFVVLAVVVIFASGCTSMLLGGGQSSAGSSATTRDVGITQRVQARLQADARTRAATITVRTYNATVTLTGAVVTASAREAAGTIAKNTAGVRAVNNQVLVER